MLAAEEGHVEVCLRLAELGAKPDLADLVSGPDCMCLLSCFYICFCFYFIRRYAARAVTRSHLDEGFPVRLHFSCWLAGLFAFDGFFT